MVSIVDDALVIFKITGIDWHGLGPAKEQAHPEKHIDQGKEQCADRIDMRDRIQRQAARVFGGVVSPAVGDKAVGEFVKNHGHHKRQKLNGEHLHAGAKGFHGLSGIPYS